MWTSKRVQQLPGTLNERGGTLRPPQVPQKETIGTADLLIGYFVIGSKNHKNELIAMF